MRLDESSEKGHSFVEVLEVYLSRMERETETFAKKRPYLPDQSLQILAVLVDENEVVNIASVVANLQFFLYESI